MNIENIINAYYVHTGTRWLFVYEQKYPEELEMSKHYKWRVVLSQSEDNDTETIEELVYMITDGPRRYFKGGTMLDMENLFIVYDCKLYPIIKEFDDKDKELLMTLTK